MTMRTTTPSTRFTRPVIRALTARRRGPQRRANCSSTIRELRHTDAHDCCSADCTQPCWSER